MTPPSTPLRTGYAEVIGDPIAHSLSPAIHGFWLEVLGIGAEYRRRRITRVELPAYIDEVRGDPNWRGTNVTMPLKLDALDHADQISDVAAAAGATNALFPRDGKICAANTDVGAIAKLLDRLGERGAPMDSVTLFGTGGAARAALVAFRLCGLTNVVIGARDMGAATRLAVEFGLDREPRPITGQVTTEGLINATPLGMKNMTCLNCDLDAMPTNGWVFDMVTGGTPLIEAARSSGRATVTGVEMLIEQAAASFELFFGTAAPRERDAMLMERLKP